MDQYGRKNAILTDLLSKIPNLEPHWTQTLVPTHNPQKHISCNLFGFIYSTECDVQIQAS